MEITVRWTRIGDCQLADPAVADWSDWLLTYLQNDKVLYEGRFSTWARDPADVAGVLFPIINRAARAKAAGSAS